MKRYMVTTVEVVVVEALDETDAVAAAKEGAGEQVERTVTVETKR